MVLSLTGIYQDGFWVSAAPMEDLAKLTMPGPAYLCRPPWPSYLEDLSSRDQVRFPIFVLLINYLFIY